MERTFSHLDAQGNVTMVDVGYHCFKTGVWSGQPMVENGHRAEENQVSSTSGS